MVEELNSHSLTDPLHDYLPFDLSTLKALKTDNNDARSTYALAFYRQIGQKPELLRCAYCGLPFTIPSNWRSLSLDHVIPKVAAERLGVSKDLWDSILNLVFCCRPCNDHTAYSKNNPLKALPYVPPTPMSPEDVLRLRLETFPLRFQHTRKRRLAAFHIASTLWGLLPLDSDLDQREP